MNPVELLTKKEILKILRTERARYAQFIEGGILPAPFEIAPGSRRYHAPEHIQRAQRNLFDRAVAATRNPAPGAKPVKPISAETIAEHLRATGKNR